MDVPESVLDQPVANQLENKPASQPASETASQPASETASEPIRSVGRPAARPSLKNNPGAGWQHRKVIPVGVEYHEQAKALVEAGRFQSLGAVVEIALDLLLESLASDNNSDQSFNQQAQTRLQTQLQTQLQN